jgi:GTP-binding protein
MGEDHHDDDEQAWLERGRLLFARPWQHVFGAPDARALRPATEVEVAFAGRSNVGKSSLINALTGQKALARTSATPGRTRELNFFSAGSGLTIVDMPGYGYARASKADAAAWEKLVADFLRGRARLRRIYLLVDARHGLKDSDVETLKTIDRAAVSCQVVLTKADRLKAAEVAAAVDGVTATIARRAATHPTVLATSSGTGSGIDVLRAEIAELLSRSD